LTFILLSTCCAPSTFLVPEDTTGNAGHECLVFPSTGRNQPINLINKIERNTGKGTGKGWEGTALGAKTYKRDLVIQVLQQQEQPA
jgi:hypothetical protein